MQQHEPRVRPVYADREQVSKGKGEGSVRVSGSCAAIVRDCLLRGFV